MKFFFTLVLCFFLHIQLNALDYTRRAEIHYLIEEQPDLIEFCIGDRYYVNEERLVFTRWGVLSTKYENQVRIKNLYVDETGYFILCKKKDVPKEAQEHYDKAGERLCDALGHSVGAALSIPNPFVMAKELKDGTKAWVDAAKEYNAGKAAENKAKGDK